MTDSRRDFLLRFAATALAAASGGCTSNAEEPAARWPDIANPMHMAVYGPPPRREITPPGHPTLGGAVFFGDGRLDLDRKSAALLANLIAQSKRMGDVAITLEGHCDERGGSEYNLALGQCRADAVKRTMVAAGIPAGRITALSFGKERPRDPGHTATAWATNRRVDIIVAASP